MTKRIRQNFDLVGGMELIVEANVTTIKRTPAIEECHGYHVVYQDEVKVSIVRVALNVPDGFIFDITDKMTDKTKELIANELEVY
jgi:uncharacterized protein YbdZ (MbtH family)